MFKIKRNYNLRFYQYCKFRMLKRYNPSKIRFTLFMCKAIAIETKHEQYECGI